MKNIVQDFCIATIQIPDNITIKVLTKHDLPSGWQSLGPDPVLQSIGDEWTDTAKYAVLRIPSVVIADEYNYLINPLHPDAEHITIINTQPFVFDQRLKK